jgi:hypothetical protein
VLPDYTHTLNRFYRTENFENKSTDSNSSQFIVVKVCLMAKLAIEYRNESDKLQYVLVEERLSEKHEVSHSKLTSLKLEPSAAGPGASASIGAIEQQKKQEATGSTEKPSGQSASSDVRGKHVLPMESVRYQVDDWQVRVLVRYETGETFGPYYRQHPLLVFGLRQDTYPVLKMFGKEVRCGNRVRLFSYKYGDALRMVHSKKTGKSPNNYARIIIYRQQHI